MKCFRETLFGHCQGFVCLRQLGHLGARLHAQLPFFRQRVSELLHFDIVERFLEHQQAVGLPDFRANFLPRIVGIRGADDDLHIRIDFPDLRDRFNAIPAGRHSHIHECQRIRPALLERFLYHFQPFFALEGRIQFKALRLLRLRGFFEKHSFHFIYRRLIGGIGAEDVVKI
jgi:hypothetical protein